MYEKQYNDLYFNIFLFLDLVISNKLWFITFLRRDFEILKNQNRIFV